MGIPSDAVLARKLRELESALRQAFASRRNQEMNEKIEEGEREINDEISRRIEFLRNLLCAEMESHQGSKPTHLFHIAERLALLEDAYQRWLDGGSSPNEDDALDNVSTCSCTFSCSATSVAFDVTDLRSTAVVASTSLPSLHDRRVGVKRGQNPKHWGGGGCFQTLG